MSSNIEDMDVCEQEKSDKQIPSVVKSHLPPHLQPRGRKPLEASKPGVNAVTTTGGATPANIKRRQLNKWFNSPTDAFLSPCTQKLMKPKHEIQVVEALNFEDMENEDQKQMSSETSDNNH